MNETNKPVPARGLRGGGAVLALCALALALTCGAAAAEESPAAASPVPRAEQIEFDTAAVSADIGRYIDSVRAKNGLIASFTDSAPYFFGSDTGRFLRCNYGKMGYLEDQAFTYDLALAIIAMLLIGQKDHAEQLLSVFENEFYLKKNGRTGLFNSYLISSNIPVEDLMLGSDGDRIHAGPTLWIALAALNHAKIMRNTRFLEFTLDMVHWCRTELTYYRFPDGERGAVSMGFGWGPDWSKIFSTEHNIDYFAVLRMLHDIHAESPEDVRAIFRKKGITDDWLVDEMEHVGRWLTEVAFDKEYYCFVAGVNEYGVDRLKILDGTSWGLAGVGPENFAKWGIDLDRLVSSTEGHFSAAYRLGDGRVIQGFDFTDRSGTDYAREPFVWFEGTGQMLAAYCELGRYYERRGDAARAAECRAKALGCVNSMHAFSYANGLEGALPYMAVKLDETQVVKTLKYEWEIPRGKGGSWVKSVSSTMWFLYCVNNFYNPMKWRKN